jgi:succinoglycan biosynthesis transport protein ExoP
MSSDDILSLPRIVAAIKREVGLVVLCTVALTGLAVAYAMLATPKYTASTSIMLDPTHAATISELSSKVSGRFDDAAIVSQIELIKSRRVATKALEYLSAGGSPKSGSLDAVIDEALLERVIDGLRVFREGESFVLTIKYTAEDAELSARRANAFAQAYIYDQINSFSEDSGETEGWLQAKIDELRKQSVTANAAVQKFRKEHNIIATNGGSTVNEQQLGTMNSGLSSAQVEVAAARVRYLHAKKIVDTNNISAAVAEAFDNEVINNIRADYLSDQQKYLELKTKLGTGHESVQRLQGNLAESRKVIFSEMRRLAQSYKNQYEIALARQKSLENNLGQLVDKQRDNDGQYFELAALEKEAESYTKLYDEFLTKYQNMQQQQSFPVGETRIITKAVPPLKKSHPKSILISGLGLILGAGLGVLLALLKDNFDRSFKRAGQIESATGLHFLGFFPELRRRLGGSTKSTFLNAEYTQSVDEPMSLQAETCRNIKLSIHKKAKSGAKVLGIVSDHPHNAKSVTAANLALYMAQSGSKCLLIDADLRNPVLSAHNFINIESGVSALLSGAAPSEKAMLHDTQTGLYVIAAEDDPSARNSSLTASGAMQAMIEKAKTSFDTIIVDLPPLSATSDASFSSVYVDYFLLVLEWGKSQPNNIEFNLKVNEISKDKVLGVVLGNANMKEMARNYGHKIYSEYTKS